MQSSVLVLLLLWQNMFDGDCASDVLIQVMDEEESLPDLEEPASPSPKPLECCKVNGAHNDTCRCGVFAYTQNDES